MSYQGHEDHNHHNIAATEQHHDGGFVNDHHHNNSKEFKASNSNPSYNEMGDFPEGREAKSGIAGLIKNPYVFLTCIFASIGGVLFGCKYIAFFICIAVKSLLYFANFDLYTVLQMIKVLSLVSKK